MPKFVQNPKKPDEYIQNLSQAVEDMWAEMYVEEIEITKIDETIRNHVNSTIKYWTNWTMNDLHKQSSYHKRKMR